MIYYVLDCETASLSSGVVELAWLKIDESLNILEEFRSLCNPERAIEPGAFAVHGISQQSVATAPTLAQLAANLPSNIDVIGHQVSFDCRMTRPHVSVNRQLCTLSLSREYVKGTSNSKLSTLRTELKLPESKDHSALGDVHTCRNLLQYICNITGLSVETLFQRQDKPKLLTKMLFGKHKGKLIISVPSSYRAWLLAQDIDKDLRYTLEKLESL